MRDKAKFRVLFVCIGNACRSPMGEAIANKEAADVMDAASAGLYPLGVITPITRCTLEATGYPAGQLRSKGLREFAAQEVDLVVNMSGIARPAALMVFQTVEDWDVADPYGENEATYRRIFEEIRERVRNLAERLRTEQMQSRDSE